MNDSVVLLYVMMMKNMIVLCKYLWICSTKCANSASNSNKSVILLRMLLLSPRTFCHHKTEKERAC